jgi:uncharacterized protein YndB with AHSA1/START domain
MTLVADRHLTMTRRFAASPERLFDAWTDADRCSKWLFTTPQSERHSVEIDLRVGGAWRIIDRRGGVDYTAVGEYLEIERPTRLAFSFGMPQFSDAFSKVTVEFAAYGDGAVMTLTQEDLPPEHIPATRKGWAQMFAALAALLAEPVQDSPN